MREIKKHIEDDVRYRTDDNIHKIKPYRQRVKDADNQYTSEYRICLIKEDEKLYVNKRRKRKNVVKESK